MEEVIIEVDPSPSMSEDDFDDPCTSCYIRERVIFHMQTLLDACGEMVFEDLLKWLEMYDIKLSPSRILERKKEIEKILTVSKFY